MNDADIIDEGEGKLIRLYQENQRLRSQLETLNSFLRNYSSDADVAAHFQKYNIE